jgi:hypothetical protein
MAEAGGRTPNSSAVYVDLGLFERAVGAISELMAGQYLRLLIGSTLRRFQFALREDEAGDVLGRFSIDVTDLRAVLVDLEDVLVAVTSGVGAEMFVAKRSDPDRFDDGETEDPGVAAAKYELATESFDVEHLRRRVWLKRTSKSEVPGRFDWEVATKMADAENALPDGDRVVMGKLRVASEPAEFRLPYIGAEQEITVTVDVEDVEYMIDSLNRLKEAMYQADKEEVH